MRWQRHGTAATILALAAIGCGGKSASRYPIATSPASALDRRPIEIDQNGGQQWPMPVPSTYRAAPGRSCQRLPVSQANGGGKQFYLVPAPPGVSAAADGHSEIVVRWRLPRATEDCRPQAIALRAFASHSSFPGAVAEATEPIRGETSGVSRLRFKNAFASRKPDVIAAVLIPAKGPQGLEGRPAEALVALPNCRPGGPSAGCTLGRPPLPTTPAAARRQLANSDVLPGRLRRIACARGAERSIVCDIASVYDAPDRKVQHSARVIIRPQK
jgi:hypothetical protein